MKEKGKAPETDWKTECARFTKAYLDYRSLLLEWKECYAPKTPEEEWDGHFVTVLRELSIVEYYLDILLFGDEEDKKIIVKEKGREVEKIEPVSYTHLRAHETDRYLVCRLLLFPEDRSLRSENLLPSRGVAGSGFRPLPNIPHCCLP